MGRDPGDGKGFIARSIGFFASTGNYPLSKSYINGTNAPTRRHALFITTNQAKGSMNVRLSVNIRWCIVKSVFVE